MKRLLLLATAVGLSLMIQGCAIYASPFGYSAGYYGYAPYPNYGFGFNYSPYSYYSYRPYPHFGGGYGWGGGRHWGGNYGGDGHSGWHGR
jgi:hypothetical protein